MSSTDVLHADAESWVRVLDGYPPIDLGYGTGGLPAEQMLRILLADLDSFDYLTPDQRADPVNVTHQRAVLEELGRLREVLDLVCTASATTMVGNDTDRHATAARQPRGAGRKR